MGSMGRAIAPLEASFSRSICGQIALRYSGEMPVLIHPRLTMAAWYDPVLTYMIRTGLPLTRETWISLSWLGGPPKPCCEMEVPEFWQDHTKVEG